MSSAGCISSAALNTGAPSAAKRLNGVGRHPLLRPDIQVVKQYRSDLAGNTLQDHNNLRTMKEAWMDFCSGMHGICILEAEKTCTNGGQGAAPVQHPACREDDQAVVHGREHHRRVWPRVQHELASCMSPQVI